VRALQTVDPSRNFSGIHEPKDISVFFMFPGQGAQYIDMGKGLYDNEPLFRTELERCARHVSPQLGFDLLALLYPKNSDEVAALKLMQTAAAQPAIFAIDYSLARLWLQWGIQPEAMIGHSVGEYVAACLAGVLSLEDALYLVAERGRLMQSQPAGAMLAVQQSEQELGRWLSPGLELAAVNGPDSCVATGPAEEVEELEARLASAGVACRHLNTSHAFHSAMMEPVLKAYHNRCRDVFIPCPANSFHLKPHRYLDYQRASHQS
jgi:acyl transferase domain-containing protein